jgi:hypothetical protein
MQEFEVIQTVVESVVLVEMTAHQVGEVDKARMDKCPRSIAENYSLEFCDREEESELDEVGDEFKPARRDDQEFSPSPERT